MYATVSHKQEIQTVLILLLNVNVPSSSKSQGILQCLVRSYLLVSSPTITPWGSKMTFDRLASIAQTVKSPLSTCFVHKIGQTLVLLPKPSVFY